MPGISATRDSGGDAESIARRLDQIQVAGNRREEAVLEILVDITVVDRQDIERRAPQTVAHLFRGEPGTCVQPSTPGQGMVIIRGLNGSDVLHMVDGFRLNNACFRNAPKQCVAQVNAIRAKENLADWYA